MKTTQEWREALSLARLQGNALEAQLNVIAEIQRDARERMVPAADVQPLVKAFLELLEELHGHEVVGQRADDDIYWYNSGETLINLSPLRAKHPNLFT